MSFAHYSKYILRPKPTTAPLLECGNAKFSWPKAGIRQRVFGLQCGRQNLHEVPSPRLTKLAHFIAQVWQPTCATQWARILPIADARGTSRGMLFARAPGRAGLRPRRRAFWFQLAAVGQLNYNMFKRCIEAIVLLKIDKNSLPTPLPLHLYINPNPYSYFLWFLQFKKKHAALTLHLSPHYSKPTTICRLFISYKRMRVAYFAKVAPGNYILTPIKIIIKHPLMELSKALSIK